MRIDRFLKKSGIVKRRKAAHDLCNDGLVLLNGRPVKPGKTVRRGDVVSVESPSLRVKIKVIEPEEGKFQKIVI